VAAGAAAAGVAAGALSGAAWRWVPRDLPDPKRFAASASREIVARPIEKTTASTDMNRFIEVLLRASAMNRDRACHYLALTAGKYAKTILFLRTKFTI
jgi:hypothetical protein